MGSVHYRGYGVTYDPPPIPDRSHDWRFEHEDIDLDDPRHGTAATLAEAKARIDEIEEGQ
jgi:hypothetical protein